MMPSLAPAASAYRHNASVHQSSYMFQLAGLPRASSSAMSRIVSVFLLTRVLAPAVRESGHSAMGEAGYANITLAKQGAKPKAAALGERALNRKHVTICASLT